MNYNDNIFCYFTYEGIKKSYNKIYIMKTSALSLTNSKILEIFSENETLKLELENSKLKEENSKLKKENENLKYYGNTNSICPYNLDNFI